MAENSILMVAPVLGARKRAEEIRDRTDALRLLRTCYPDKKFDAWSFGQMVPFVLREGGSRGPVIACAFAGHGRDGRPALHWVATHPEHRRKGLAREVCLRVLEYFTKTVFSEYAVVTVRLTPPTDEARALYESLGFKEET